MARNLQPYVKYRFLIVKYSLVAFPDICARRDWSYLIRAFPLVIQLLIRWSSAIEKYKITNILFGINTGVLSSEEFSNEFC